LDSKPADLSLILQQWWVKANWGPGLEKWVNWDPAGLTKQEG